MKHKGVFWIAVLCFVGYVAGLAFWSFPQIEAKLEKQANALESVRSLEMSDLEFHDVTAILQYHQHG